VRQCLRELAGPYRRCGYLRLHIRLQNEGLVISRKRTLPALSGGKPGCAPHDRSLEAALQRTPAAQLARLLATQGFCHLPEKTKTRHTHCRLTLGADLIRGEGQC
jgi:hypothetical protein